MRATTLFLLAASLGACAADPPGDDTLEVVFDVCQPISLIASDDATVAERRGIEQAAAMWTALAPYPLAGGDDAQRIEVVFQDAAAAFHGFYDDQRGIVFVNRGLTDEHQRAVTVAHELGHSFGLLHIETRARASVMNPANLVIEPNADDADALAALWGECP
ncbi:MAG TPA: hypothetical protein VMZ28_13020 [Kofleriaceae bacterium]|nr:hypothetical protein [Kofleriaceae bacterium]